MNSFKKFSPIWTIALFGLILIVFALSQNVSGSASHNMSGFAWSDNIGWVSMNNLSDGSNRQYGVTIDPTTKILSGYGWSDNIGWISFNSGTPNELVGCPSGECRAKLDGSKLAGWARACGIYQNNCSGTKKDLANGDWDGWISLSGSNYGVTLSGANFSGYAWGGDVVGWLNWTGVTTSLINATVSLTANPTNVVSGGTSELVWNASPSSSFRSNSCVGTGFTVPGGALTGTTTSSSITSDTTFSVKCSPVSGADISASALVTVALNACNLPEGGTIESGQSKVYYESASSDPCVPETRVCTNGVLSGSFVNPTCGEPVVLPPGTADLMVRNQASSGEYVGDGIKSPDAQTLIISSGANITLRWETSNMTSCSLTDSGSVSPVSSGTRNQSDIQNTKVYTLNCNQVDPESGNILSSDSDSVRVVVTKVIEF